MSQSAIFTNVRFDILANMYERRDQKNRVAVTQEEIAVDLGLCRATVNRTLNELKSHSFIVTDQNRVGRYIVTKRGRKIVELIRMVDVYVPDELDEEVDYDI